MVSRKVGGGGSVACGKQKGMRGSDLLPVVSRNGGGGGGGGSYLW